MSSSTLALTATYVSPAPAENRTFSLSLQQTQAQQQQHPATPTNQSAQSARLAHLAALRPAVTALQSQINAFLTAQMAVDAQRAEGDAQHSAREATEEGAYGEEEAGGDGEE